MAPGYESTISEFGAELPVGCTDNGRRCPFCEGGRNGDRGFSITRTSEIELKYCCHRASCGKAGVILSPGFKSDYGGVHSTSQVFDKRKSPRRVYDGKTGELDSEWLSNLDKLFGLTVEDTDRYNWCLDIDTRELVVPILAPTGIQRGTELRRYKVYKGRGPKTKIYISEDMARMGWFRKSSFGEGPIVLVEDAISALKVSRQAEVACLLGSYLGLDHILEIVEVSGDRLVLLALDRDATSKAIEFIKDWRFIAPNFVPCPLSKEDLKYWSNEEIKELLDNYKK